jgi:UDP-N-acetylglucosamine acyltransferase
MVGMSAVITRDVPPFAKIYGSPAKLRGANTIGMSRRGIAATDIDALHAAYLNGDVPDEWTSASRELSLAWEWWAARTTPAAT